MKAALYYFSLPLIYLISLLPFGVLQILSNFLFFIIYRLVGYRKKVVWKNLKNSFPNKTEIELKRIQIDFYRYFFDIVLETIKTLTISKRALGKRVTFTNTTVFQKYFEKQQSIIIVMGHFGNWELGGARFALEPYHKLNVVYHPLQNKHFDRLMYKMRTRLGNGLYPMKGTLRGMINDRKDTTATAFIADQKPPRNGAYWMDFLNQDTPVFVGTGKIASKLNYPVIYASIKRTKRGYYNVDLEELCSNPRDFEAEEIVHNFMNRLEKNINEMPETWLWTHNRWKIRRK